MKRIAVDLNSDVGESYGPYKMGDDENLFPFITSANIACGFHAGDPTTIRKTLDLAAKYKVAVGAHPGYPDRFHFGREALPYSTSEIVDFVLHQIGALQALAQSAGLIVHHVKFHGALYHIAAEDRKLAEGLLEAIVRLHPPLIIVGPAGSALQKEAEDRGLDFAVEGFADRAYGTDGKLVPRSQPNALLSSPEEAAEQALSLVRKVQTLCIHGDTPGAAAIANAVRQKLEQSKIAVQPLHELLS